MQNELRYTVRSREIVDLLSAMRNTRLTLSPYFQRNLVWRDAHRRDFIDTILKGYPFPQIFLARGPLNLDTMEASQAVVDGQQRLNAIRDFVAGKLEIEGKKFKELPAREQEEFLKYEVAVIDFDLDAGDPRLKDVFHRLNRTYYSLSAIEKLSSEYSASEFLLVARTLCGEIAKASPQLAEMEDELAGEGDAAEPNIFSKDPFIEESTWQWMLDKADGPFPTLIKSQPIFTNFEFDRKIPLMFTLNLMCTYLTGYYQRNDRVRKYLDERAEYFPERDELMDAINEAAIYVQKMEFPDHTIWWSKANFFTLMAELSRQPLATWDKPANARSRLLEFERNLPPNYSLAAREAVSRKAQRELRGQAVRDVLFEPNVIKERDLSSRIPNLLS